MSAPVCAPTYRLNSSRLRAGTSTHVHVDSGCTRFYMLQLYGRKLWRVFAPDEDSNLHRAANGHFEADVLRPDAARWPAAGAKLTDFRRIAVAKWKWETGKTKP